MNATKFLYKEDGFPNFRAIAERGMPFNVVLGGRGTGKTYNAFDLCYNDPCFMWLRRGAAEADATAAMASAPWKTWFSDHGKLFRHYKSGLLTEVWEVEPDPEDETKTVDVQRLGYIGAVTNFANVRGYDAYDVTNLVIDEFIPEKTSHIQIREETTAFLNICESIGRNRELQGKPPLKVWLLGNTNSIVGNELYMTLGVDKVYKTMCETGRDVIERPDIGVGYYNLKNSPISEAKKNTSLYKLAAVVSPDFVDMAISNSFAQTDDLCIRPNLRGLDVAAVIGDIAIYCMDGRTSFTGNWHIAKSIRTEEYCDKHRIPYFPDTKQGLAKAYEYIGRTLEKKYKMGLVTYESSSVLIQFLHMLKKRGMYDT